jgi:hypothetical protein
MEEGTSFVVPPLPITFRQEQAARIMQCVRATDSCAIVGVSGTGKGNLLLFLTRADVRQHYLGADGARTLFIYVDFNKLREVSDRYVYELCMRGLLDTLQEQTAEAETPIAQIAELHRRVLVSENPLEGQVALEEAIKYLTHGFNFKLVFAFDEFDRLVQHLDPQCFLALRALRDEYKLQLCYVIAMRRDPAVVAGDLWKTAESFFELLTINMFPLPPYNDADAECMLQRLASRFRVTLSRRAMRQMIEVMGGHAELLAVAFRVAFGAGKL